MKFCPNCGSPLNGKDICDCGFSIDGKVENDKKTIIKDANQSIEPMAFTSLSLEEIKRRRVDSGNLVSISFETSGGMEGCYYYRCLDFENNKLIVVDRQNINAEQRRKEYTADKEVVEKIKKLVIDNNMQMWIEIPNIDWMIAIDEPTSSFTVRFESNSVNISTRINMDEEERAIYREVFDLVNSLIVEKNLISDEIDNTSGFMKMNLSPLGKGGFCPKCGYFIKETDKKCICGFEKKDIK